ncbi:MAG TPA: hypothetical protein VMZ28_17030 [Kofleriaceae bacterium]|nr:hypothetical protein [Kofleriaceae bacterium]
MSSPCEHRLCELIGGACALTVGRSRGCGARPVGVEIEPEVFDEVRALLGVIDPGAAGEPAREAAVRLAAIIRREALEDRSVLAQARTDEPELVPALERLCLRRR